MREFVTWPIMNQKFWFKKVGRKGNVTCYKEQRKDNRINGNRITVFKNPKTLKKKINYVEPDYIRFQFFFKASNCLLTFAFLLGDIYHCVHSNIHREALLHQASRNQHDTKFDKSHILSSFDQRMASYKNR